MNSQAKDEARDALSNLRAEIRDAGRELRATYACWKRSVRSPATAASL